jgi:hypothetical protein
MNRCSCQSKRPAFRKAKVQSRSSIFHREISANRRFARGLCSQSRRPLIQELLFSVFQILNFSNNSKTKLLFELFTKLKTFPVLPESWNRPRVPSSSNCPSNYLHFLFSHDLLFKIVYFRLLIFLNFVLCSRLIFKCCLILAAILRLMRLLLGSYICRVAGVQIRFSADSVKPKMKG